MAGRRRSCWDLEVVVLRFVVKLLVVVLVAVLMAVTSGRRAEAPASRYATYAMPPLTVLAGPWKRCRTASAATVPVLRRAVARALARVRVGAPAGAGLAAPA